MLPARSQAENGNNKRAVIIAAFGLHDAASKTHIYPNTTLVHNSYGEQQEYTGIRLVDGSRFTALAACRNATAHLVRAAVGGSRPSPLVFLMRNNDFLPGNLKQEFLDNVHRLQQEEIDKGIGIANTNNVEGQRSSSGNITDEEGTKFAGERESTNDNNRGGGVFVVDNSVSLYSRLACYRIDTSVHYYEPVKLVEAKMLWDLISLVDREDVNG